MLQNLKKYMFVANSEISQLRKDSLDIFPLANFFRDEDAPSSVLRNLPLHVYWKDANGLYVGCNDTMAKSDGLKSGNEIVGTTDSDSCVAYNANALRKTDVEIMRTQKMRFLPEEVVLKNTRFYSGWSYKWPLYSKHNNVVGLLGVSFNITLGMRKQALVEDLAKALEPTLREIECLYFVVRGCSIKTIARRLNISTRTVEHHLESVKIKLVCFSREDLIAKAWTLPEIKEKLIAELTSC